MKKISLYSFTLLIILAVQTNVKAQEIILSAVKGESSKTDTLTFNNNAKKIKNIGLTIEGVHKNFFKINSTTPKKLKRGEALDIIVSFHPSEDYIGIASATLVLKSNNKQLVSYSVRGLSIKGIEGSNEAPLDLVVKTLGYTINMGWTTLSNHIKPDLQGEEIPQTLFKKVNEGNVEMIPVARYSPPFSLPFGYYTTKITEPILHEVGTLADTKDYPEHQTLFPILDSGTTVFDSGNDSFGFYTTSPTHTTYSEDRWNTLLFEKNAAHATRIYPVHDASGKILANQYLVCFEEASNGDYQDYVFLVKNIQPVSN